MKIYSTRPFPEIPQKWNDTQYIYYYNRIDNGEQPEGSEGTRYEADFVVIDSIDQETIDKAIELANSNPDKARDIVDNIQPRFWHHKNLPIQVFINHERSTAMILKYPLLMVYMEQEKIVVMHEPDGVYIYLTTMLEEHRNIFNEFNGEIKP